MSFADIMGNEKAKTVLKNELRNGKKSGTYLFYGNGKINCMSFAMGFAKGINCGESVNDFCDKCRVCINIEKRIYPDLYIYNVEEGFGIDTVRSLIYEAGNTSYEGGKKVFIIQNIQAIRKEAANALLKTIEEPPDDTFFILLSKSLNILPTIKSRSIVIDFYPLSKEDLGVAQDIYDYFDGDAALIMYAKDTNLDISVQKDYKEISNCIGEYIENENIKSKIDMIKCIKDFCLKERYISEFEKLMLADQIEKAVKKDKNLLKEILSLFIVNKKNLKKAEYLLELKMALIYNVSPANILYNFMINI